MANWQYTFGILNVANNDYDKMSLAVYERQKILNMVESVLLDEIGIDYSLKKDNWVKDYPNGIKNVTKYFITKYC